VLPAGTVILVNTAAGARIANMRTGETFEVDVVDTVGATASR
jgi:hypothetical protein